MTVNFYLDRKQSDDETAIFVYIRGIGGTLKFHTGEKIEPVYWDKNKQTAKKTYIGSLELNSYLNLLREDIKKTYRILITENKKVTLDNVRDVLSQLFIEIKPQDKKNEFWDAYEQFISSRKLNRKEATIKVYYCLLEHFRKFESKSQYILSFQKINLNFYDKFYSYLTNEIKQTNNTVSKYIRTLKTFLNWASERELNDNREYKKFKRLDEEADTIYLTEDELMRLYYLDLSKERSIAQVRDIFCFGCFTGQRFSDISNLKRDDIKGNMWYLHVMKTKRTNHIPLNDYAIEVLKKYTNNDKPLPVVSSQRTNEHLKKLGELAEIDEPITIVRFSAAKKIEFNEPKYKFLSIHTARRTFITLSLEKGMRPEVVMEITGHTDYRSFKKYIKLTSKVKITEMKRIWRKEPDLKLVNM